MYKKSKNQKITIRITDELLDKLENIAEKENKTISYVIRKSLENIYL